MKLSDKFIGFFEFCNLVDYWLALFQKISFSAVKTSYCEVDESKPNFRYLQHTKNGNYIHDDNGGYLEFEALFVEPADIVPIIEKLSDLETKLAPALTTLANLEKRLANLENTAIQGVIL